MMGNDFVKYLNSMNNASGDNIHALAEAQVTNKYYNSIRVDRKLGKYIVGKIQNNELKSYIITGHAGDGKTSILVQILKELNLLPKGESLKINDVKENDEYKLMYVKDMSELDSEDQAKLLKNSLEAPEKGMSSVLISNTGPLIKSFVKLYGNSDDDKDEIENILLKQLDSNECEEIEVSGKKFYLINIARIENIGFVREIINKITDDELWTNCASCGNGCNCPLYFNKLCVARNKDRVIKFVEMYYRWLQENDKRITIRQMLSQISFAFTGNQSCDDVKKYLSGGYSKFNFNFANLFFGYRGIELIKDSEQIKGIKLINELALDDSSFTEDYDIFVKENFDYFSDEIREEVKNLWHEYNKRLFTDRDNEGSTLEDKQQLIRKSIRRFFLMYGYKEDKNSEGELYNQIYGNLFNEYINATSEKLSTRQLKKFARLVFEALFIKNVGVSPTDEKELYLTLTRNDSSFQSVLLKLATASENRLEVKQNKRNVEIEDVEKGFTLKLIIDGRDEFNITLPILIYFNSLVDGEVNTEINPSLSHGLAELNAKLIRNFREKESDSNLSLIVNTVQGVKEVTIEIEDENIYFDV